MDRQDTNGGVGFFDLPQEMRDWVYDYVLGDASYLFRRHSRMGSLVWRLGYMPPPEAKQILTFPDDISNADHVHFNIRNSHFGNFLAADLRIRDEVSQRMYDTCVFRVLVHLSYAREKTVSPTGVEEFNNRASYAGRLNSHFLHNDGRLGPQLPAPNVMSRIKELRLEIFLNMPRPLQPDYSALATMKNLKHVMLNLVWPKRGVVCSVQWAGVGDNRMVYRDWRQVEISHEMEQPHWRKVIEAVVTHIPHKAVVEVMCMDWTEAGEGVDEYLHLQFTGVRDSWNDHVARWLTRLNE